MSGDEGAAVARLEVQVSHLVQQMADMKSELKAVRTTLDEGAGGMRVIKWFFPASLATALTMGGIVYGWFFRP